MNSTIVNNALRFIVLLLLQGLVLKRMEFQQGLWIYFHVIIYPAAIMLLPLRTPLPLSILLGFVLGLSVDLFYQSLGIHAAASVFLAYVRPIVLRLLEPRGKYNINYSPTRMRMGMNWFARYVAILLALHLFFYFSVEAFTFVYIVDILLNTVISFVLSFGVILMIQLLFDPVE